MVIAPLLTDADSFKGSNILSINQFTMDSLRCLFGRSSITYDNFVSQALRRHLTGKSVLLHFREPSTRTRLSFERATYQCGGSVMCDLAPDITSDAKNETLADGMITRALYSDVIVSRNKDERFIYEMADAIGNAMEWPSPLINAGNGADEHPTQTLLELFTIYREFETLENHKIAVIGDLKYGRAAHSFVKSSALLPGARFYLVPIPGLELPHEIRTQLDGVNIVDIIDDVSFEEALAECNIWTSWRLQEERLSDSDKVAIGREHIITKDLADRYGDDSIILHPLPRGREIHPEVDRLPQAKYFEALPNGVAIRMALLELVAGWE